MGRAKRDDPAHVAADARVDQIMTALRDGARDDIAAWASLGRKLNDAADTRVKCAAATWSAEEMYHLVRLAHGSHAVVTGRLLGRRV